MKTSKIFPILFLFILPSSASLPLYANGRTGRDSVTAATADSVAIKKQIRQDSLYAKFCEEVGFVIDKIENVYVCGRRGMDDEEWNRRVQMIYDKGRNSDLSTNEYYYAFRYCGLLLNDGHFQFPDGGIYNKKRIFKKEDVIFPIRVKTWEDGSVYTVRDYTGTIPENAEIISVNGRSAKEMALLNRMLAPTEDLNAMDYMNILEEPDPRGWMNFTNFLFTEQIKPPFNVIYKRHGSDSTETVTLQGMQRQKIYKLYKKSGGKRQAMKDKGGDFFSDPIRYEKISDDLGILTINSFWSMNLIELFLYNKDDIYPRQLSWAMKKIYRDKVKNLIIDIRLNGGGLADNMYKTLNYFTDRPIDAAVNYTVTDENRELTKIRAKNSLGKYLGVSKKQTKNLLALIDSLPSGTTFSTDTLFKVQYTPGNPKHRYRGNVYLLTSNYTFSAAQMFAQYFKEFNIGKVAGRPCGGYTYITGGNTDKAVLPGYASFLDFYIPTTTEKRYMNIDKYEYETVDIPIERTFDEWLSNNDKTLDKLIDTIESIPATSEI